MYGNGCGVARGASPADVAKAAAVAAKDAGGTAEDVKRAAARVRKVPLDELGAAQVCVCAARFGGNHSPFNALCSTK